MISRIVFLVVVCSMLTFVVKAQDDQPDRVPKQYSIEFGYCPIFSSDYEHIGTNGINLGLDYAWQLTGLTGKKKPVFISVPLSYTYFTGSQASDTAISILTYGWTVRHHLTKGKPITPYFGYSLLLSQMKVISVKGADMGHQTKFEFGLNFERKKAIPFVQLEYSMIRFPQPGIKDSYWIQSLGIKGGFKF
jgi:hypothetical protein